MDMLTAMRVFVNVVDTGSLSTAARKLGMGQATISERLARLEAHLGETLIERTTRTSKLTPIGRAFYDRSKRVIEAAAIAERVSSLKQTPQGKVSVSAPAWIGEMILPALLIRFRQQHPELRVELLISDQDDSHAPPNSDITIRLGSPGAGEFAHEELGILPRILVASPDYLHMFGTPSAPQELLLHSFVMAAGTYDEGNIPLTGNGAGVIAPVNVNWFLPHWRPLVTILEAGAGIGVVSSGVAAEALASGRLVRILPDYSLPPEVAYLLYAREEDPYANAGLIRDFLRTALRSHMAFVPQELEQQNPTAA